MPQDIFAVPNIFSKSISVPIRCDSSAQEFRTCGIGWTIDSTLLVDTGQCPCFKEEATRCGTWWRIGWFDDFHPDGRGFDSRSSRHVGTLGKSFTRSCLCSSAWNSDRPIQYPWCSRERLWVVEDLKGRYRNGQNEWMNKNWLIKCSMGKCSGWNTDYESPESGTS